MAHEHGSEYQMRIVHEDETEELSGWMNCQEEVAQSIIGLRGSRAKAYWLRVRNIVCLNCLHRELTIVEFPLTLTAAENAHFPRQQTAGLLAPPQAAHLRLERNGRRSAQ
jgi:hypothetical protein